MCLPEMASTDGHNVLRSNAAGDGIIVAITNEGWTKTRLLCKTLLQSCDGFLLRCNRETVMGSRLDHLLMTHDIVCSRLDCCSRRPSIHHQTTSELHELSAMYAVRLVRSCKPRTLFWMISTDYHASDINSSYCWSRRTVAQVSRT